MSKILIDIPQETYDYIMNLYTVDIPRVETRGIQYTVINAIRQGKVIKEQPETSNVVKGFKAFNKNLKCRDMQYKIGNEYEIPESPIICERGFHFCKNIVDVYNYYDFEGTRVCEVEAYGEIETDDNIKFCTNKIRIVKEIENPMERSNIGYHNIGYKNTGNSNSGKYNTGNSNTGDYNSGHINLGRFNSGIGNAGDYNSGGQNLGNNNSGSCNIGRYNAGYFNYGHNNSGGFNLGNYNSGNCNIGNGNTGNHNFGYRNSGDWNVGSFNIGLFNTNKPSTFKMFDVDSDWTFDDWEKSDARIIMNNCPYTYLEFIYRENMSDEEKEKHPEYKTIGGYTKVITVTKFEKQKWWSMLSDIDKQTILDLPNFNAEKFKACTGIDVSKN